MIAWSLVAAVGAAVAVVAVRPLVRRWVCDLRGHPNGMKCIERDSYGLNRVVLDCPDCGFKSAGWGEIP